MRRIFVVMGLALVALPARAETKQQFDWCWDRNATADQLIDGCTAVIQSGHYSAKTLSGAFNNLSTAHINKRELDSAIADATQAIALDPANPGFYQNRGNAYNNKGLYDQAIADYNQALALQPNFALAYPARGWAYRRKGLYDNAIADYTKAIALNPNAPTYESRGEAYEAKGLGSQAMADYRTALNLDPNNEDAKKGLSRLTTIKPPAAPTEAEVHDQQLLCYKETELILIVVSLACVAFSKAGKNFSASHPEDAYRIMGELYAQKHDYGRSIANYTEAIRLEPENSGYPQDLFDDRGQAYYDNNDYDHAIADYTEAIRLKPDWQDAFTHRGNAYYMKGDYDRAIIEYTQSIQIWPTYEAFYWRGRAYHYKHDYDRALADYTETISDLDSSADVDDPEVESLAYLNRGLIYEYKDENNKAIADYRAALTLAPNLKAAQEGLKRLTPRGQHE